MKAVKDIFKCDMSSDEIIKRIDDFLLYGDINIELSNGSLLHKATYIKHAETRNKVIEYLLDKDIDINMLNKNGRTALFRIVYLGNNKIINKALDKGVDVNVVDNDETTVIDRIAMSSAINLNTTKRILDMVDDKLVSEKNFRFIIRQMKNRYGIKKVKETLDNVSLLRFWLTVSI